MGPILEHILIYNMYIHRRVSSLEPILSHTFDLR